MYHVKVLMAFLRAAVPLGKVDCFRQILGGNALWLTDRSHVANLIPLVRLEEQAHLKEEIRDKPVSVFFFYGTT